jgi:hypothetical protein
MFTATTWALVFAIAFQTGDQSVKQRSLLDFPAFSMQILIMDSDLNGSVRSTCLLITDGGVLHMEKSIAVMLEQPRSRVFTGELPPASFEDLRRIISTDDFRKLHATPKPTHIVTDTVYRVTINQRGQEPQIILFESPLADKPSREAMKPLREWLKTTLKLKVPENKNGTATGCSPI